MGLDPSLPMVHVYLDLLLLELIHPGEHDRQVRKDLHLLCKLVVHVLVGEAGILEAVVHSFEGLNHTGDTLF